MNIYSITYTCVYASTYSAFICVVCVIVCNQIDFVPFSKLFYFSTENCIKIIRNWNFFLENSSLSDGTTQWAQVSLKILFDLKKNVDFIKFTKKNSLVFSLFYMQCEQNCMGCSASDIIRLNKMYKCYAFQKDSIDSNTSNDSN